MKRLALPAFGLAAIVIVAILAPVLPIADPIAQNVAFRLQGPSAAAWLGRDEVGRDVLARLIWGARGSLAFTVTAALLAGSIGTFVGLLGAWFRGVGEIATLRVIDVILCFPPILLAMLITTLLGSSGSTLVIIMSVLYIPGFARIAYAQACALRSIDYVEAVRALGANTGRILSRTVLPNIAGALLVQFSLTVASSLVLESGLSFLGIGIAAPAPSWGGMISAARANMHLVPLLLLWPALTLVLTIYLVNMFCDRLRDVLDPVTVPPTAKRQPARATDLSTTTVGGLLRVEGLTVAVDTPQGPLDLVSDIGLTVEEGRTLALVGESGSGKSITASAIMGLLPASAFVRVGRILFEGRSLVELPESRRRGLRGRVMAMIFQNPMSSLHPMQRVGRQIAEAVRTHRSDSWRQAEAVALELLRAVQIADPLRRFRAYPHELSGGMRQRIMIAAAIANKPRLLIADEPTTALDVTVQAQILALLERLRRENGMAILFISHSLGVVSRMADDVAVMYAGQIVETGAVAPTLANPRHPYTRALLAASPEGAARAKGIGGLVPRPDRMPPGCRFAPRCKEARDVCRAAPPTLESTGAGNVRCIRWKEIAAEGPDRA